MMNGVKEKCTGGKAKAAHTPTVNLNLAQGHQNRQFDALPTNKITLHCTQGM